ncbi:hypothetical protein ONS95_002822 [Cadophora gregata]|uniref:uncharacterized protein n=1 Tax=Cadophora gregata TaxID=51156 RepID=UPI0026DCB9EB|nr:uncharacterized protein ONS95_002822 [Cadophora gregata]KAK0110171.1 hypothetical protein ONS95_002822 [Cadophora gregata]KAK0110214.1 hypothetical protein ONS96_001837 [Cadophora gregata f. sp. sojae]
MSQNHPHRRIQVPSDAPFELKPSPGKGLGVFATRRISEGAMVLKEKPLFIIWKPHEEIREEDIRTAFQQLAPTQKGQFLCLRGNASKPFKNMSRVLAEKSFALSNSVNDQRKDSPSHGMFLLHSRFNHSCIPNSKIPTSDEASQETLTSFATRNIVAGEEITLCYNTDFEMRTRLDRRQELRFVCDCKACLPGTLFQRLSDIRRSLIRGLQYLTLGKDLDGRRQDSDASPIIFHGGLKRAAEEFKIPLSDRFVFIF